MRAKYFAGSQPILVADLLRRVDNKTVLLPHTAGRRGKWRAATRRRGEF